MAAGLRVRQLTVDGLTVTVERKHIRNLYLRLRGDGSIHLSAPWPVSEERLREFIRSRRSWIEKQQAAEPVYQPQYVSGEGVPLWGEWYPLRVYEQKGQTRLESGCIHLYVPAGSTAEQRQDALYEFYRAQVRQALPRIAAEQEAVTGLHADSWQVREMQSRWGSCTIGRRSIRVNLQLARFPETCLRYLVTHELTHLLAAGHDQKFYAYLERFDPNWREARACLRAGAPILPPETK